MRIEDARKLLETDEYNLDTEWLTFPSSHQNVCDEVALMRRKLDEAQDELAFIEAKLGLEVINQPTKFGLRKATEGVRTAVVRCQREYRQQQKHLREVRHEFNNWSNLLRSMESKRKGLENLVMLYSKNYYSEPRGRMVDGGLKTQVPPSVEGNPTKKRIRRRMNDE